MDSPRLFTVVFVIDDRNRKILLGFKKRGLLQNKWNGFGGKVEPGETISEAALRELTEECGLRANILNNNGILTVEKTGERRAEVHLFTTNKYDGEVLESTEMLPEWFNLDEIPFGKMTYDTAFWLPRILENQRLDVYFKYNERDECLDYRIDVLRP